MKLNHQGIDFINRKVHLCKTSALSLLKNKLPAASLAYGNVLEDIPEAQSNLTKIEEFMIALCRAKAIIFHLRGGEKPVNDSNRDSPSVVMPNMQRGIRGHIITHPQRPDHVARLSPPFVEDIVKLICIVFVGSKMPTREWLLQRAKPLVVRANQILNASNLLKAHNPLYNDAVSYLIKKLRQTFHLMVYYLTTYPRSR
jgi:hypothetical protein